jgi:hypothetical protein
VVLSGDKSGAAGAKFKKDWIFQDFHNFQESKLNICSAFTDNII